MKELIVKNIDNLYCLCKTEDGSKVGDISTDAVSYLEEGQEIDPGDCFPIHTHDKNTGAPIYTDAEGNEVETPIFLIKGPCGHFH